MVRDAGDANGKPSRAPGSVYDLPWVKGTGFARQTGDPTGLGWKPSLGWPKTRDYFSMKRAGKHDMSAETEAMRSLGNKWRKR